MPPRPATLRRGIDDTTPGPARVTLSPDLLLSSAARPSLRPEAGSSGPFRSHCGSYVAGFAAMHPGLPAQRFDERGETEGVARQQCDPTGNSADCGVTDCAWLDDTENGRESASIAAAMREIGSLINGSAKSERGEPLCFFSDRRSSRVSHAIRYKARHAHQPHPRHYRAEPERSDTQSTVSYWMMLLLRISGLRRPLVSAMRNSARAAPSIAPSSHITSGPATNTGPIPEMTKHELPTSILQSPPRNAPDLLQAVIWSPAVHCPMTLSSV